MMGNGGLRTQLDDCPHNSDERANDLSALPDQHAFRSWGISLVVFVGV